MTGRKENNGLKKSVCVPRIIGEGVVFNPDTGESFEYDELNCDSCIDITCINWLNAHTEDEKHQLEQLLDELTIESED